MRYIVLDLEATCWERNPPAPHETIEFGAVCYDGEEGVRGEFQSFVKPLLQPILSDFCVELTHIQQSDVDGAAPYPVVLERFSSWCETHAPYLLCSWGAYDAKQLREDCVRHGVPYPFTSHLNLKRLYSEVEGCKPQGMKFALLRLGMELEGTHHRGIDDARNIVRLLQYLLGKIGSAALEAHQEREAGAVGLPPG